MFRKYLVLSLLLGILSVQFFLSAPKAHAQVVQRTSSVVCAVKLTTASTSTCFDQKGNVTSEVAIRTAQPLTNVSCALMLYQNGPFVPSSGNFECWTTNVAPILINIPSDFNDQASSWGSCPEGTFFVNSNGGGPSAGFGDLRHGNFPFGAVPNDSLSSFSLRFVDNTCLFQLP